MRYCVLLFLFGALAAAQSASTVLTTDINGRTVADGSVITKDGVTSQTTKSINNGQVPVEQTTERVLSETPSSKVTEKIIKRFSQTGALISTERVVTEHQTRPSGETLKSTTYTSDINGRMTESERKVVESTTHGNVTDTQTEIARPTPNGFGTVEKRSAVTEKSKDTSHSDEIVYRISENGGFFPAVRTVTDTAQSGAKTVEKSALYEPIAEVNRMELSRQVVTTTATRPDGTTVSVLDYYGPSVPGNVRDPSAPQKLYEQDTVERKPRPDGSVVETLSARRVNSTNPNILLPPIKVSETVCTGKCNEKPQ